MLLFQTYSHHQINIYVAELLYITKKKEKEKSELVW